MMNQRLMNFLAMAKKKTYASTTSKVKKTKDGGKNYKINQGDYVYTDTYFGNLIDCGQERVYVKGKVVWAMAYRGGITPGNERMHTQAFSFLKKCMRKIPKIFPIRGPKQVKEGDWLYVNKWRGDVKGFVGEENIYYKGKKITFRNYVGGLIKNDKQSNHLRR